MADDFHHCLCWTYWTDEYPMVVLVVGVSGNVVAVFFIFFLCPETSGKTLEQVEYPFENGTLALKMMDIENAETSSEGARRRVRQQYTRQ
jgi:hypothetical protein